MCLTQSGSNVGAKNPLTLAEVCQSVAIVLLPCGQVRNVK